MSATKPSTGHTAPVIVVLAVVIVAAMAFAVPPAPIEIGDAGAYLIGQGRLSAQLADQLSRSNYGALVIDFTGVDLGESALWRSHFAAVDQRGYPIWGWVDLNGGVEQARAVARGEKLARLYVYGPDAVAVAAMLDKPSLRVVPVLRPNDAKPDGEYAVVVDLERFLEGVEGAATTVLRAGSLGVDEIDEARAHAAGTSFVVARIAIAD